ncbi:DUF2057 family protein [Ferrimonas marina]|uniref:DUF2057 domain-containing protein n=1 Tax=Ferrimonas marina TaxID=299255 RepID=A0A1M5QYR9_9GAMM|nr:DUF2057 family protein [Ferrimonas marina]SHH18683.1 hypothetical protein SAMN02745129_1396 [Ferrimonas marina]
MKALIPLALLFAGSASAGSLALDNNVRILTLNGEPVESYSRQFNLGEGTQVISVRYDALFETSSEHHDFVRSGIQVIKFEAESGQQYMISAPKLRWEQARDYAEDPSFNLTNSRGENIDHRMWSRDELLVELLGRQ